MQGVLEVTDCPILTQAELVIITGRVRKSKQAEELKAIGLQFATRTDGSIVVRRVDWERNEQAEKNRKRPPQLRLS